MKVSNLLLGSSVLALMSMSAYAGQRPPMSGGNNGGSHHYTTCAEEPRCHSVSVEDIDLLIFYDPKDKNQYRGSPSTFFEGWKNQINDMYRNSGVGLRLNIVGVEAYDPAPNDYAKESQLKKLTKNNYVNKRRDELNADFVTLIKSGDQLHGHKPSNFRVCGIAHLLAYSDNAFSVIQRHCGALTLAHEMGHNMGLNHSRKQGDQGGAKYRYGLGHGVQGKFATIMAYPEYFRVGDSIGRFSNPKLHCRGYACGVEAGQPDEADAVKALNNARHAFSQFRVPYRNSERATTPTNGYNYSLQASHSNQCLTDGTQTKQQDCNNTPEQTWQLQAVNDNVYKIVNNKGQCLSLQDKQNYNGTALTTTACDNSVYQQWEINPNKDEYTIKSVATSRYMEVQGASQKAGAIIDQWNYYNGGNQKWVLNSI